MKRRGKFKIAKSVDGEWFFTLTGGNGEVILVSQMYSSEAMCAKGIRAVRLNAPLASVESGLS